jgi:pimeloyl-ACP methyl ester carboxylesterase
VASNRFGPEPMLKTLLLMPAVTVFALDGRSGLAKAAQSSSAPSKFVRFLFLACCLLSLGGCCSVNLANLRELPPGRSMSVGGYQIFVRQTGTGPDVVLLHGLGDSSIGWQFIEPGLVQAGFRVTVWDALGAGRSEKPAAGDYRIQAHVNRLVEMLDALEIREAVLVGHSLGGSAALLLAERNPERVRALCVIDPAAYRAGATGGRWLWSTPLLPETVLCLLPSCTLTRIGLKQNFHNHGAISQELEDMYLREARREGAVRAFIAQERQVIPPDPEKWEQAHRMIQRRTLVLWGGEDKLIPLSQGQRLTNDVAGSTLVVLPGVGHSPHLEAPQLVLDQLVPFLGKVSPPCMR